MAAIKLCRAGRATRTPGERRGRAQEQAQGGAGRGGGAAAPLQGLRASGSITRPTPVSRCSTRPSHPPHSPTASSFPISLRFYQSNGFCCIGRGHKALGTVLVAHCGWWSLAVAPGAKGRWWQLRGLPNVRSPGPARHREDRSTPCCFAAKPRGKHRPILFISLKLNPMAHLPGDFRLNGLRNSNRLFNPVK